MSTRIPITVVTGFLGSGKTTLLRHLLTKGKQRLAVMVNEFGSVGLDGDLIRSCGFCPEEEVEGRLVELNNGCLCCTVQDDFLPTMETLLARSGNLDGIVIETSGLALPRPLLKALDWPAVRVRVHINGVVTLVDGDALSRGSPVGDPSALEQQRADDPNIDHLTTVGELFEDQLKAADLVLISRADKLSSEELEQIKAGLVPQIRVGTPLIPVSHGDVDPPLVLGLKNISDSQNVGNHKNDHSHVEMISGTIRLACILDRASIEAILPDLIVKHQVVRLKGRIWLPGKTFPLQLQMVGSRITTWFEAAPEDVWRPDEGGVDLVVIGFKDKAAEAIRSALKKTFV